MSRNYIEGILWAVTLAMTVLAVVGWRRVTGAQDDHIGRRLAGAEPALTIGGDSLSSRASRVAATDPFRLDRRPSGVPFSIAGQAQLPQPVSMADRATRPPLVLTGTLGGEEWQAVIEGILGRDGGVVVRQGQVLGALHVARVGRDTVVIEGADTTWTLTVRMSWQ